MHFSFVNLYPSVAIIFWFCTCRIIDHAAADFESDESVTPQTLLRYFFQTERHWSGHFAEGANLDFGVAFANAELSRVKDANRIFDVALPEGVSPQEIFEQVTSHFAALGTRCNAWLMNISAPAAQTMPMVEWLTANGFREHQQDILYLEHLKLPPPHPVVDIQVLPARASYRHAREFAAEQMAASHDAEMRAQFTEAFMADLEDPQYESLLALKDGRAIATVGVLTVGEIGRIEPLFVAEVFRRQGVARMMMGRAIEICARSLFKHVFLSCVPSNAPAQSLYHSLGFTKIGQMISYLAP